MRANKIARITCDVKMDVINDGIKLIGVQQF